MTGPEPTGGLAGWAQLHGGIRPSGPVRVWLRAVQGLAGVGPISRTSPDVLSATGVLVMAGALGAAVAGGRWALLAALLVAAAGVLDGLDGAVALRTGRARPLGAVVDALADRVGDLLLAGTLLVLGAPGGWCAAAAALVLLHEYLRSRAMVAGMPGVGAVTVAERPTRIILVTVTAAGAGIAPAGTPLTGWGWATVGAVAWTAVGVVGLGQLVVGVVRTTPAAFTAAPPVGPEPRGPAAGPDDAG